MLRLFWIEHSGPGRLAIMSRPSGGEDLERDIRELKAEGATAVLSFLERDEQRELDLDKEAACCAAHGILFHSFAIIDRGVPGDEATFTTLTRALADEISAGGAVVLHCRAGIGRSSLGAAAILAHCGIDGRDAIERISLARGLRVPDTDAQKTWIQKLEPRR